VPRAPYIARFSKDYGIWRIAVQHVSDAQRAAAEAEFCRVFRRTRKNDIEPWELVRMARSMLRSYRGNRSSENSGASAQRKRSDTAKAFADRAVAGWQGNEIAQ
jgi:hypothetical protein